ncbi:MAG: MBL fold metallo-hydrolase [Pseudothermotoga sp.]
MVNVIDERITHLLTGPIGTNTYVLKNNPVIVIDPGYGVKEFVRGECIVLLTHMHFDHICGLKELKPLRVYISKTDLNGLRDPKVNKSDLFRNGFSYNGECEILPEKIELGEWHFRVIETPGHTMGSVVYATEKFFFTGDTIFMESIGRTDFPESDETKMLESLRKLARIFKGVDRKTFVLPGHMEWGFVGDLFEKNCFFKEALI